jgi:hypothetical protein
MAHCAEIIDLEKVRAERALAAKTRPLTYPEVVAVVGLILGLPAAFWTAVVLTALRMWK